MDIKSTESPVQIPSLKTKPPKTLALKETGDTKDLKKGEKISSLGAVSKEKVQASKEKDYNVTLSPLAKELREAHSKAYQIAKNTSPIREDRVKELQEKINAGTYKIDPGQIADGMLREAVKDSLAETDLG